MIMAGGIGSRMNSPELPKQYLKVNDEPIIVKTIKNFEDFGSFTAGVVCCPIDWIEYTKAMLLEYGISTSSPFASFITTILSSSSTKYKLPLYTSESS